MPTLWVPIEQQTKQNGCDIIRMNMDKTNSYISTVTIRCFELGVRVEKTIDANKVWARNHTEMLRYCKSNNIDEDKFLHLDGYRYGELKRRYMLQREFMASEILNDYTSGDGDMTESEYHYALEKLDLDMPEIESDQSDISSLTKMEDELYDPKDEQETAALKKMHFFRENYKNKDEE